MKKDMRTFFFKFDPFFLKKRHKHKKLHKLRFQIKVTTYLHKILRKTKQTKNEQTKIKLNKSKTR